MENIDELFRSKITEFKSLPTEVKWTKDKSWQKVKKKQGKYKLIRLMKYAAAIILLLSVSYMYLIPNHSSNNVVSDDINYEKEKQLLQEMNQKLGIIEEVIYVCDNCIDLDYYIEYKEYSISPIDGIY